MNFNLPSFKSISEKFLTPKGIKILLIIGVIGIALIFLSDFMSSGNKQAVVASSSSSEQSLQSYTATLETKMKAIISNIDGVGKADVMITFESGTQYIYEQTAKETNNTTDQTQGDGGKQTTANNNNETTPVIITADSGGQQPLIKTELLPDVKGVVIVCDGGDDATVQENVSKAVSIALGLSSNHICVTKKSK
jgi:stage III sporulation protein AG